MERKMPAHLNWILRSAVVLGGLSLAACAPMAVPGDVNQPAGNSAVADVALQNGADDTAMPGSTSTSTSTDDSVTPVATSTILPSETSPASTPEGTETPQLGVTATAVAGQEVEFIGTIETFENGVLMVSGRKVVITAQTEVKFQPQKGLNVKVEGALQNDGSVVAREISSVSEGQATHMPDMSRTPGPRPTHEQHSTREANETEFTGTVSSINGNVFVVDGVTVIVTGEIKGSIAVGDKVKVHGVIQPDGSVLAREIEKDGSNSHGGDNGGDDGHGGHGGHGSDDATPAPTSVGGDDRGGDRDGHGSDDVTATPMPTSVSDDSATPAPTTAPTDDHGGHGDDDKGGDDNGDHGEDDNGGHGNP